jgi:hypothetical protein
MRGGPLLATLVVVIATVGIVAQPVAADDEWTGDCGEARTISPGAYSGTLSPNDQDSFAIDLPEGDYITIRLEWDTRNLTGLSIIDDAFKYGGVEHEPEDEQESSSDMEGIYSEASFGPDGTEGEWYSAGDAPAETTIYSEGEGPICVGLIATEGAGDWRFSFARHDAEPPELVSQSELDERSEQKDQRIAELESLLEQKNQTIARLENENDQTDENGPSGDTAIINVAVEPAGDRQNFISGGAAHVTANSENADWNEFSIEYKDGMYSVDEAGASVVPLTGTGEQQLTFHYQDTTETVNLDVQSQPDEQGDVSDQSDDTSDSNDAADVEGDGSGFGLPVTVLAILSVTLLLGRDS